MNIQELAKVELTPWMDSTMLSKMQTLNSLVTDIEKANAEVKQFIDNIDNPIYLRENYGLSNTQIKEMNKFVDYVKTGVVKQEYDKLKK